MATAVIFGGTGFIGVHFARYLLEHDAFDHVVLFDLVHIERSALVHRLQPWLGTPRLDCAVGDVRVPIALVLPDHRADVRLIANFAAVHREPGHEHAEYFQTNLPGARNVCSFAEQVGCESIIFSSSIAVYGPVEAPTDELALPTPTTAYGSSKLAAELIHEAWRDRGAATRRLLIVRPGVVFGEGEGGNVTRLVKALKRGVFVFAGNRKVRKAGIYVKELCSAMWWLHQKQACEPPTICVANASLVPGPTLAEYVEAVRKVGGYRCATPTVPAWLLLLVSSVLSTAGRPLGLFGALRPERVRKTLRSNNVVARRLTQQGYTFGYTVATALEDWRSDCPADW